MWRLPLPIGLPLAARLRGRRHEEHRRDRRRRNAIVAGLILEEFVDDIPWAHLDIAGVGWSDDNRGYLRKGGIGFGVRTMLELLERYEPLGGADAGPEPIGKEAASMTTDDEVTRIGPRRPPQDPEPAEPMRAPP